MKTHITIAVLLLCIATPTNTHAMFKIQVRYAVQKRTAEVKKNPMTFTPRPAHTYAKQETQHYNRKTPVIIKRKK